MSKFSRVLLILVALGLVWTAARRTVTGHRQWRAVLSQVPGPPSPGARSLMENGPQIGSAVGDSPSTSAGDRAEDPAEGLGAD